MFTTFYCTKYKYLVKNGGTSGKFWKGYFEKPGPQKTWLRNSLINNNYYWKLFKSGLREGRAPNSVPPSFLPFTHHQTAVCLFIQGPTEEMYLACIWTRTTRPTTHDEIYRCYMLAPGLSPTTLSYYDTPPTNLYIYFVYTITCVMYICICNTPVRGMCTSVLLYTDLT